MSPNRVSAFLIDDQIHVLSSEDAYPVVFKTEKNQKFLGGHDLITAVAGYLLLDLRVDYLLLGETVASDLFLWDFFVDDFDLAVFIFENSVDVKIVV